MNVNIVDDFEIELDENFLYTLERVPGLNPNIQLDPILGEIVIVDNDGKIVQKLRLMILDWFTNGDITLITEQLDILPQGQPLWGPLYTAFLE